MKKNLLIMLAATGLLAFQSCSSTEFASHLKNGDMVKAKQTESLVRTEEQKLTKSTKVEFAQVSAVKNDNSELALSASSTLVAPLETSVFETTSTVTEKAIVSNESTIAKFNKKEWKANFKKYKESQKSSENSSKVDQVIVILCAIFIPPLGVFLFDGIGTPFWISLILTILFFFPGMIYSLLHVLGVI